ncbi:MAG TPA: tetratricopeptide repeat protein [Longimicrobiales bacterium]
MRVGATGLALLAGLLLAGFGIGDLERGNRLYRAGRYAEAVEAYRAALAAGKDTPELRYNLGTALVRLGQYEEGETHLRAALSSIDPDLRQRTLYNLGNRFLEEARGATDPQAQAALLDRAIASYREALRLQPGDAAAKWNLELALREEEQQQRNPQSGEGEEQSSRDQQDTAPSGGQSPDTPAQAQPGQDHRARPQPTGGMTREQAERILSAAEQDERELYRERMRRSQRERPVERDW